MNGVLDTNLIYRALIIVGLIGFGFFLAADRGLIELALTSDKSYLSYVILAIYVLATCHWLWLVHTLTRERRRFALIEQGKRAELGEGPLAEFFRHLDTKTASGAPHDRHDHAALVGAFGDALANRHAFGHFIGETLLKLGLVGTIVGFILMLLPVGEIQEFDASQMQRLLSAMSGGMAVALYTTLAGLVTSTLLKLQYHVIDASAADLATRLQVWVDVANGAAPRPRVQAPADERPRVAAAVERVGADGERGHAP